MKPVSPKKILSGKVMVLIDRESYLRRGNLVLPQAEGGVDLYDAIDRQVSDADMSLQGRFRVPVHGIAMNSDGVVVEGDTVFFAQSTSEGAEKITTDKGECLVFSTSEVFLSIRDGKVIMHNGVMLGTTKVKHGMLTDEKVPDLITVSHLGTPTKNPIFGHDDAADVKEGDTVVYAIPYERFLELHTHTDILEPGLRVINRRHVLGIYKD